MKRIVELVFVVFFLASCALLSGCHSNNKFPEGMFLMTKSTGSNYVIVSIKGNQLVWRQNNPRKELTYNVTVQGGKATFKALGEKAFTRKYERKSDGFILEGQSFKLIDDTRKTIDEGEYINNDAVAKDTYRMVVKGDSIWHDSYHYDELTLSIRYHFEVGDHIINLIDGEDTVTVFFQPTYDGVMIDNMRYIKEKKES